MNLDIIRKSKPYALALSAVLSLQLMNTGVAYALEWPMLQDFYITSWDNPHEGVKYGTSGSVMTSAPDRPEPGPSTAHTINVIPWGVHCSSGDTAATFSGCSWSYPGYGHSPTLLGKCQTISPTSWVLTSDSTCTVANTTSAGYYVHVGAGPGAECTVFGKAPVSGNSWQGSIGTPWGDLTALQVAQSGNTYCVKALPINVVCDVVIPGGGIIDHGIISTNALSSRTVPGTLNCGDAPSVTILGNAVMDMAGGVTSTLSVSDVTATGFTLNSMVRAVNATPGEHQASAILVVSPQ